MSQITKSKSDLIAENTLLRSSLIQIRNLTLQIFDINANVRKAPRLKKKSPSGTKKTSIKKKVPAKKIKKSKAKPVHDVVPIESLDAGGQNEDDIFSYLQLQKVQTPQQLRENPRNDAFRTPSKSPATLAVSVVINRLTQSQIEKATRSIPSQTIRRFPPRKAAPTNLKEMTPSELKKTLKR